MDSRLQSLRRAAASGDVSAQARLVAEEIRAALPPFDWPPAQQAAASMTAGQRLALKALLMGQSAAVTGPGGTGKSWLVRTAVDLLRRQGREVAVTASTGRAAASLGGETVHRWSGCGVGDVDPADPPGPWFQYRAPVIRATDTLIVDEVSQVHARLLTIVEALCRRAKGCDRPWGGLQVVFVGDHAQLPPVEDAYGFCFEADAWAEADLVQVELRDVVRQQDPRFVRALHEARLGALSGESLALLESRVKAFDPDRAGALRLATRNCDADRINGVRIAALRRQGAPALESRARDWFADPAQRAYLGKLTSLPKDLTLAVGARVILLRNDPAGRWQNGSQGSVTGFADGGSWFCSTADRSLSTSSPSSTTYLARRSCTARAAADGAGVAVPCSASMSRDACSSRFASGGRSRSTGLRG